MAHSYDSIYLHIVFSTKHRQPILGDDVRQDLHAYIGGIVSNLGGVLLAAGSVLDHIHLLVALPRRCAPAAMVQEIKRSSSRFLKTKGDTYLGFAWQTGYSVFSVSPYKTDRLKRYIENQAAHHRKQTFEQEYRMILEKHEIVYDENHSLDNKT